MLFFLGVVAAILPAARMAQAGGQGAESTDFFEKKIRPVLIENWAKCHNPKARVAELDLTTAEGFRQGGESGPLVDRQKPESSRLLSVIAYDSPMKMPPTGKLRDEEISAITAWVSAP